MLARLKQMLIKEFIQVFRDKRTRFVLFGPPIIQMLIFGYAATYDLTHVPYAVLDQSRGAASAELLARVDGTGVFFREATLTSSSQIAEVIDSGDVLLVLSIPSDFQTRLAAGRAAPLQLILDGRNSSTAGAAAGYVNSIVSSYNQSLAGSAPPVTVEQAADILSWFMRVGAQGFVFRNPNLTTPELLAAAGRVKKLLAEA